MPLNNFISLITIKDGLSIGGIILVIALSLIQVSSIKINPWDKLLGWFGSKINADTRQRLESLEKKLDEHIQESVEKSLRDSRTHILDFCNSCMNKRRHTREEFDYVIGLCDEYEEYIEQNNIKNGVITSAIAEIRRIYTRCLQKNDFLKEGEDDG